MISQLPLLLSVFDLHTASTDPKMPDGQQQAAASGQLPSGSGEALTPSVTVTDNCTYVLKLLVRTDDGMGATLRDKHLPELLLRRMEENEGSEIAERCFELFLMLWQPDDPVDLATDCLFHACLQHVEKEGSMTEAALRLLTRLVAHSASYMAALLHSSLLFRLAVRVGAAEPSHAITVALCGLLTAVASAPNADVFLHSSGLVPEVLQGLREAIGSDDVELVSPMLRCAAAVVTTCPITATQLPQIGQDAALCAEFFSSCEEVMESMSCILSVREQCCKGGVVDGVDDVDGVVDEGVDGVVDEGVEGVVDEGVEGVKKDEGVDGEKEEVVDDEKKDEVVDGEKDEVVDDEKKEVVDDEKKEVVDDEKKEVVDGEKDEVVDGEKKNEVADDEKKEEVTDDTKKNETTNDTNETTNDMKDELNTPFTPAEHHDFACLNHLLSKLEGSSPTRLSLIAAKNDPSDEAGSLLRQYWLLLYQNVNCPAFVRYALEHYRQLPALQAFGVEQSEVLLAMVLRSVRFYNPQQQCIVVLQQVVTSEQVCQCLVEVNMLPTLISLLSIVDTAEKVDLVVDVLLLLTNYRRVVNGC